MGASCPHGSHQPAAPAVCYCESLGATKAQNSDFACVLAWGLTRSEREHVTTDTLQRLHMEVAEALKFFGATLLEDNAISGMILGNPMITNDNLEMSAADVAVRMGQLLCRWASAQNPNVGLRAGVHCGALMHMKLPSSQRTSYFGPACAVAIDLLDNGEQELTVQLTEEVKPRLQALASMRFTISRSKSTYILDPATEVLAEGCAPEDHPDPKHDGEYAENPSDDDALMLNILSVNSEQQRISKMPLDEFEAMLQKHNVDLTKFGKRYAKSLEEFYDAVVHQEKSFLTVKDGRLERVVELVRIFLRIRDKDFKLRELRIKSEKTAGGRERVRNQPLAMVLSMSLQGKWQAAIEKCFQRKFGIDIKAQKANFTIDKSEYRYREEKGISETVPGILSTYRTHSIHMYIRDKDSEIMKTLGLPGAVDFCTGEQKWTWAHVENCQEDELAELLINNHIDLSSWSWYAFHSLYDELYEKMCAKLEEQNGDLIRTISIIKVWLIADILNVDHVLVVRSKMQRGAIDNMNIGRPISMRMLTDQSVESAAAEALMSRLGIPLPIQRDHLVVDPTHTTSEEMNHSKSFPGLKTLYVVNEVCVRIKNAHYRQWQLIGLPGGTDFSFSRWDTFSKTGEQDLVVTHWGWQISSLGFARRPTLPFRPTISDAESSFRTPPPPNLNIKRVQPPEVLHVRRTEELLIGKLMMGRQTDWTRARRAAARIRDPDYTTRDFLDDVNQAFPELRLYCISPEDFGGEVVRKASHGGARTANDEYQRTIGALFAFFWLMRLHLDGKECFCFGLDATDEAWNPRQPETPSETDKVGHETRLNFYRNTDWNQLQRLVIEAGMLNSDGTTHDVDRTLAFIVLMAIHDIMKMDMLQPQVGLGLEEFSGYKTSDTIMDHDVALSYVLEHCPQAIPSFCGLSEKQQESIRFTHSKMEYNMGWLVQGEAPPGALFRPFRKIVIQGGASPADIAFYFAHWFCDLAGAEPTPMEGCEKFVLKFPLRVLANFIDSFRIVWSLGPSKTETEVLEDYLLWRWTEHVPSLGPPPVGPGTIAQMRLVLMAQGDSMEILRQFNELPEDDKRVLSREMAMTGCLDQHFQRDDLKPTKYAGRGPALLVYYSPALMQKAGRKDPRGALRILAEIFREARELWPLTTSPEEVQRSVIVRIDALKDLETSQIRSPEPGYGYILHKSSGQEGQVKLLAVSDFRKLDYNKHQALSFYDDHRRLKLRRELLRSYNSTIANGIRQNLPGFISSS